MGFKSIKKSPMKLHLLIFILLVFSFNLTMKAQDIPQNVKVNELSNAQVKEAKDALDNSGISRDVAIQMAREKGASEQQIQEMLNRMDGLDASSNNSTDPMLIEDQATSTDEKIDEEIGDLSKRGSGFSSNGSRFGSYLFSRNNISFEPNPNLPTPKNYKIGIGDQILVSIWGNSQASYQLQVNRNGQVLIPDLSPINIAGLNFEAAEQKLIDKLSGIYADMKGQQAKTFAQIDLGKMRSIKVNIIGEAQTPGAYTLPATASVFNALYLSGGPNAIGSFRHIKIIRNKQTIKVVDIYNYLLKGDQSENLILQDEDIIFIPTIEMQVKVQGAFKRNALFELKKNEDISQLINFAGGYNTETYLQRLKLYRKSQDGNIIYDFTPEEIYNIKLNNGDVLVAEKISNLYQNRIIINGAVMRPGEYELTENLSLLDLIIKADNVTADAFLKGGHLLRLKEDLSSELITFQLSDILNGNQNIELKPEDVITIKSHFQMKEKEIVIISGEVNSPSTLPYLDGMSLRDAIYLANGFNESADSSYIEVSRRMGYEKEAQLGDTLRYTFHFSLSRDLNKNESAGQFLLQADDRISVRRSPGFREPQNATITGEVKLAGRYALNTKNLKIADLVEKAGGLTPEAYAKGAQFQRKGSIVGIDLTKIIKQPNSAENLTLMNGDVLIIPQKLETVAVKGNVQNPMSQTYLPGKDLKYYINKSGGFKDRTYKKKIYVKYANETTAVTHCFLGHNYPTLEPGCEIIVPLKPEKVRNNNTGQWLAVASTLSTIAVAITAILK